jgi:hypothetical protein
MQCPYCWCEQSCGRERFVLPARHRSLEVYAAVADLYSKHRWVLDLDVFYLAQEFVYLGYFDEDDPPTLVDTGTAPDVLRQVNQ